MKKIRSLLTLGCLWSALSVAAGDELFDRADELARAGNLAEMQRTYEEILSQDSHNVRAMNGHATALAWQGRYVEAQRGYAKVLALEPDNVEALTGLGYARAWSGDYVGAREAFGKAHVAAPDSLGVLKGEAFVHLWSGDYDAATAAFEALASQYPDDAEILTALGQSRLQQGSARNAVAAFDRALAADPGIDAARMGRVAAFSAPPSLEVGAWFGSTSHADSGLRQVEVAWWANRDTRIAARYDDSLSLDNPALARSGAGGETRLLGVMHRLNDHWAMTGEAGLRDLPDGGQDLYRGELIWSNSRARVTFGAQSGKHELGYDDSLTYVGVGVPLGRRWSVEVNNYFSETGVNGDDERRSILNAEYKAADGWSVLVGAGRGTVDNALLPDDETVKVAHAAAFIPVGGYHRLNLTLRHEELAGESFDVAMIGFTYRMARD